MSTDWTPNFGELGASAPTWNAKRPMRIAVLGDFSGGAMAGRLETGVELAGRKPLKVEFDTLEDAIARLKLSLSLPLGKDGAPVDVELSELESFHPDQLYANVEVFAALASLRKKLNNTSTFAAAAASMKGWEKDGKAEHSRKRKQARGAAPSGGSTLDDFARLTGRPSTRTAQTSVDAMVRSIVAPFIVPAVAPNKDALVTSIDKALSDAMRGVLHEPDFQNIESLWRGVDFLLRRIETSHQLQVHLIDITAEEFAADLSSADDLGDSGLYKLLVEKPAEESDGGYSYIAGCFHFEATPPHAELLGRMARVCAHAGSPFITAVEPDDFTNPRDPPHALVREAFAALKAMPQASYLALMAPRFLLRHPYGKKSDPISSFAFEEFTASTGLGGMLWGHPALLALCVLATPKGQLAIGDLHFHHFVDADGDSVALPCTERLLGTEAAALLRDYGINAVMAHKGEPIVRLAGLMAANDDGLVGATAAPRKAGYDSRVGIGTAKGAKIDWTPTQRNGGTAAVTAPAHALDEDQESVEQETAVDEAPDSTESSDTAADAGMSDDELAKLLASFDSPPAEGASEDAAAAGEEPEMDEGLKKLLASLG